MAQAEITVTPVANKAELNAFVDLAYRLNLSDPNWVPPLRFEIHFLVNLFNELRILRAQMHFRPEFLLFFRHRLMRQRIGVTA